MEVRGGLTIYDSSNDYTNVWRDVRSGQTWKSIEQFTTGIGQYSFQGYDGELKLDFHEGPISEVEGQLKGGYFLKATLKYRNGDIYEGEVDRRLQSNGNGKMRYKSIDISEMEGLFGVGDFIEGKIVYRNGELFQGKLFGPGELIGAENNFTLKGFFRGFDKCIGTLTTHNPKNGQKTVYKGECFKQKAEGLGERILPHGTIQSGFFGGGRIGASGPYACQTYADGSRYYGQFQNDKCNGYGIFIYPNGNYYVGWFSEGEFDGEGVLLAADGTIIKQGEWINGNYDE